MKILVLGGTGFLGKHLTTQLHTHDVISVGSEYDLMAPETIVSLFAEHEPDITYHLAAYVGGIGLNRSNPADMFYRNMQMGINVIEGFRKFQKWVSKSKLIITGTVCMYPKHTDVPFKEEDLWNGYPEETNAPYGVAKKSLLVMAQAYAKQHKCNIAFAVPSNLYGPGDNFDLESSHVIPAIIRKVHDAKEHNKPNVVLWGSGAPTREFLYVKDCAKALEWMGTHYNSTEPLNIAVNNDISIKELANTIIDIIGYKGQIIWNTTMPDGQPIRRVSNKRLIDAGFQNNMTQLKEGLYKTYDWFRNSNRSTTNYN